MPGEPKLPEYLGEIVDRFMGPEGRERIAAWMRPNATFFRTKKVIRKQMIVQIISPGVTWMSGLDASIVGVSFLL